MWVLDPKEIIANEIVKNAPIRDFSFKMLSQVVTVIAGFFGRLLVAILILLIGFKLIKYVVKLARKVVERSGVDGTLEGFILSFISIAMRILVIFAAVAELGVGASSIIALLGSASLAVGLSLQGSLSNIAGGVVLLFVKPFTSGDYIVDESSGQEGYVQYISILYTKLLTLDNRTVMIPNGSLANATITNRTYQDKRMEEILVGIEYAEDIDKVRSVLEEVAANEPCCLKGEPITVLVKSFEASSIEIGLRFWVPTDDYLPVRWRTLEAVKKAFDKNGITIPFNQLDVNLVKESL